MRLWPNLKRSELIVVSVKKVRPPDLAAKKTNLLFKERRLEALEND